jgi:hypothetical protein
MAKRTTMKTFTLDIDDLAALCGLLHAKKLVGLSEELFQSFPRDGMPAIKKRLHEHGWIQPAERPDTWHFQEDLMQALAVAVAPDLAILAASRSEKKSIVFYMAKHEITEIVIGQTQAFVASLPDVKALVTDTMTFLEGSLPAEIIVAHVTGDAFDAGHSLLVDERKQLSTKPANLLTAGESTWSADTVHVFVEGAIATFRAPRAHGQDKTTAS